MANRKNNSLVPLDISPLKLSFVGGKYRGFLFSSYHGKFNMRGKGLCVILGFLMVVLCINFTSAQAENTHIDVADKLTVLPDSDFLEIVTIENTNRYDVSVRISVSSIDFGMREERTVILDGGTKDYFTFRIPVKESFGNNEVSWAFFIDDKMIYSKNTEVEVTDKGDAVVFTANYYSKKVNLISEVYDNLFVDDSSKNINVAVELSKKGMYFEAIKYLDFTRESLSMAVLNEKKRKRGLGGLFSFIYQINWIKILIYLAISGILAFLVYFFKKTFKQIKRLILKKKKLKKTTARENLGKEKNREPAKTFEKEVKILKRRISQIKSSKLKEELLLELQECKGKYDLGLAYLGDAYAKRIRAKLDRRNY